ncbi:hypothetical protein GGX14DRAFT_556913 [Mycena pura]|uniref:Uncharacterized protein n=1 Tax=Mycena pura TaxID=153505 RepID=A0AAD6YQK5_9AGAR|nr:hypothetical protein GGX14DRAFT_556913 [Mycena pura]
MCISFASQQRSLSYKLTSTHVSIWPLFGLTIENGAFILVYEDTRTHAHLSRAAQRGGSAINTRNIVDRTVDAGVERTRTRPLPSGRVSMCAVALYLLIQRRESPFSTARREASHSG